MNASMMQGMHHAHKKPDASQLTKDVFSQLDPTGQGAIDSQSFLAALSSRTTAAADGSAPAVSSGDASSFFSAMDGDSNGKVTPEEMTAMFQKVSEQFQTRMQMQQSGASTDPTQQGVQGHHHGHHKAEANDALTSSDALMQAVTAAQSGMSSATTATTAATTSTGVADQLQRQLMSMMRRYEQMGATAASSSLTGTTAATSTSATTASSVNLAA
jgi:Ca2+-binding EF-hand superfamily protein